MFPVTHQEARDRVIADLEAQFLDNQKARALAADARYERASAGGGDSIRVQEWLYKRNVEARERVRSVAPVRFNPIEGKKGTL